MKQTKGRKHNPCALRGALLKPTQKKEKKKRKKEKEKTKSLGTNFNQQEVDYDPNYISL